MLTLAPYQTTIARTLLDAVLRGTAATYTVEVARGGGAREVSAQLALALLMAHAGTGIRLLKVAANADAQVERLAGLLPASDTLGLWSHQGDMVRVGKAEQHIVRSEAIASVAGPFTLIEVEDAQHLPTAFFEDYLAPLAATTGATVVFYGRPWTGGSWFEAMCLRNRMAQDADGVRRHFRVTWDVIAAERPEYGAQVATLRQRLSDGHPTFASQYALRAMSSSISLLSASPVVPGGHPRRRAPIPGARYVASVAVTRLTDGDSSPLGFGLRNAGAVVTIAEETPGVHGLPVMRVVDHRWLVGADPAGLGRALSNLLGEVWHCNSIVIGMLEGTCDASKGALRTALAALAHVGVRVEWATASTCASSQRALALCAALRTGRLQVYVADGSMERRAFAHEVSDAALSLLPDGRVEVRLSHPSEGFVEGLLLLTDLVDGQVLVREPLPLAS